MFSLTHFKTCCLSLLTDRFLLQFFLCLIICLLKNPVLSSLDFADRTLTVQINTFLHFLYFLQIGSWIQRLAQTGVDPSGKNLGDAVLLHQEAHDVSWHPKSIISSLLIQWESLQVASRVLRHDPSNLDCFFAL